MINKVIQTIKKYKLIEEGDIIVIGVSGGPDSMCLLNILNVLSEALNIKVIVAHINHLIREEAEEETRYVQKYCAKIGVECYVKRINVLEKSSVEKIGTEEAGRKARYNFFEEVLLKTGATKIATAHNANDNAETVLMNIFRGAGTSGLKGIEPIRDNKYIRPLIECERQEIEQYCLENSLEPKIDKSNFENIYTRNKIRNILIPQIKSEFNPNIIVALNKLSALARQENEFIQKYTNEILQNNLIIDESNGVILDLKKFNELDNYIKSKIILLSIKRVLGSTQGIEKIHLDDIIKLCAKNVGNKYLTPNKNIKVFVKAGKIYFIKTC
ncbi:MAG: tRNA lysidine(34) synthetase TilS [Clostridia bacterium]|nr:tRNA lysidine(34) synthetase TilS [Clostridia bacterium]